MFRRALLTLACVLAAVAARLRAGADRHDRRASSRTASGAVLPGVTVEAKSLSTGAVAVQPRRPMGPERSGSSGLRPGKYEVMAKLQGFTPGKVENIDLRLGQILTVDLALAVGGMTETVSGHGGIADPRHQAERARHEHPRRADRAAPARPRLHHARHAGARRQQRGEARWSLDRRRERRREPLHHRRHRDDQPAERPLGQERHRRLRRRGPGQVERLHRRVRRRDGRRHQRRHQERHQRLPRQRRSNFEGSGMTAIESVRGALTNALTLRTSLTDSNKAEYVNYPKDNRTRVRAGLRARRSDRQGQDVVLRRVPAGADQLRARGRRRRTAQQPGARRRANTEQKQQVQYITANQTSQISNSIAHARGVQQQLAQARRPAADAERPRSGRHQLHEGHEVPELDAVGRPRLGGLAEVRLRLPRRLLQRRTSTTSNVTEEPRYTWTTTNNIGFLDVPADLQHGTGFTSIPTNLEGDARPADARLLPGRRHGVLPRPAASTRSSSACSPTASATTC